MRRLYVFLFVFGVIFLMGGLAQKAKAVSLTFIASSTWTAPAGVTTVQVEAWGGGGGGGGQASFTQDGGGGGGGGAYSKLNSMTTVPGTGYTVSVGAQGSGGGGGAAGCGGTGADSSVSSTATVLAKGGIGGCNSTGTPPAGGLGGASSTSVGDVKFAGGQGEKGKNNNSGVGGYGGSSAGTAADGWSGPQTWSTVTYPTANTPTGGGHGGDGGAAAAGGSAPASGNGGGGGGSGSDGTNLAGGAGAVGKIILTYSSSTITATSTQTASMNIPSTSQYVGGAFVILPDISSTITSITITENGTVNASTGLDNILLRYDLDTTAPYNDCSDQSYAADDTQFGSTDTDGFSSANGTSTFTGSVLASNTQAMCVYVELDVVSGASGNLEIRIAASSDIVTGGFIAGTFPLDIPNTTSLSAAATISCSTDISSTSFGTLTSALVTTSTLNASTTMSCSGTASGCTLFIRDEGDGTNPGLATTSPAYLIRSTTSTLVAGTEGYGIQATTTLTGSGGTLGILALYNKIGNAVGGLLRIATTVASSTADVTGREVVVTHKAAISSATLSGSYSDTITYSCTAN